MPVNHRNLLRVALIFCALIPVLLVISSLSAFLSLKFQIKSQLDSNLPAALAESVQFSLDDQQVLTLVAFRINEDLSTLEVDGLISLWQHCRLTLEALDRASEYDRGSKPLVFLQLIQVPWSRAGRDLEAEFSLYCQPNVRNLSKLNLVIALLIIMSILLLPRVPDKNYAEIRNVLGQSGFSGAQIRQMSARIKEMDRSCLPWLERACAIAREQHQELSWVLDVASENDKIVFDHQHHSVNVHGIDLPLSKTPYFYFAWYALLRSRGVGEGWVLNPSVDRPDPTQAELLIDLMQAHGGHRKAINELAAHGLRGKLLDQNRNKIKDELAAIIGEEFAEQYLFESARDLRSGRYRYRFRLPPDAIGFA